MKGFWNWSGGLGKIRRFVKHRSEQLRIKEAFMIRLLKLCRPLLVGSMKYKYSG